MELEGELICSPRPLTTGQKDLHQQEDSRRGGDVGDVGEAGKVGKACS